MTFLLLCAVFIAIAAIVFVAGVLRAAVSAPELRRMLVAMGIATLCLFVLTAVFDNLMIAAGFFDYGREYLSGIRIGAAPIEDFGYPLAAVFLLPGIWLLTGPRGSDGRAD